ncbi:helix-turn-helix domain-containing protein [Pseudonocardia eucalypti]|uniref:Helix-turn-helix domain-containing protein n=2 Tax=Pseudonocardia eucalypti TaxID=648755 RepID=A0ABP9PX88_9PSEU
MLPVMALEPTTVMTTDGVPPEDAFGYWSDLICAEFVQLEARALDTRRFAGSIEHDSLDDLCFSVVSSRGQRVDRTRRLIAASREEVVLVSIQLAGTGSVRQAGRLARQSVGTMTFYDSTVPYTLEFDAPFRQLIVQVPRAMLPVGVLGGATAVGLAPHGPGGVVADFLLGLHRLRRTHPAAAAVLVPHAVGLVDGALRLAEGSGSWSAAAGSAHLRERVHRFVAAHAREADLDVNRVATACGISRRTLFRVLAEGGEGFTELVRRHRVRRAKELLRAHPGRLLSTVAHESGFGGEAQLHRAFRAVTGTTPGAYRGTNRQ